MTHDALLSERTAEQAIVERLFRASMDVQCALSMVAEERTAVLLRQTVDNLDVSIKQVQERALGRWDWSGRVDLPEFDWPGAVAGTGSLGGG
jgi:hypothetical protein